MAYHEKTAMSDAGLSHDARFEYSYRLPAVPRVTVPPPSNLSPSLRLRLEILNEQSDVELGFLQDVDVNQAIERDTMMDWSYARRRQAQMILPWLYLGPLAAAKDHAFLSDMGITMILAVRSSVNHMNGFLRAAGQFDHEIATIEAASYFELTGKFQDASKMINHHMASVWRKTSASGNPQLGKVLVFCESGNEKSAVVVAAYLMDTLEDIGYIKAMQVAQTQRFCINFDDAAKTCLQSHWDILSATRSVQKMRNDSLFFGQAGNAGLKPNTTHTHAVIPKRSFEQTDDNDLEMSDCVSPPDAQRFMGRDITPFQDG
ncbi:unnamed protein product [Periconia digitata]|uniref:Tyrosine specific protein phosphatases domain-containing protein n=1 Tax=Periconia digitata TaxID=1303443 RepID=A0A9W4U3W3_9PLEO|nr:unnamed protein product [Periconia digitata]